MATSKRFRNRCMVASAWSVRSCSQPVGCTMCLQVVAIDGDDRHGRRHREHGNVDGAGHPLGRPVTGPGLRRRDRRVGHQVDVGPGDPRGILGQDDGAVHLGQLRQALRAELRVEQEPAGADGQHIGAVADDDQTAALGPQDAVEAVA